VSFHGLSRCHGPSRSPHDFCFHFELGADELLARCVTLGGVVDRRSSLMGNFCRRRRRWICEALCGRRLVWRKKLELFCSCSQAVWRKGRWRFAHCVHARGHLFCEEIFRAASIL
jgi:hypothetical protein